MKSIINFYYNLFPDNIINQDNFFYFWIGEEKFYFVPFNNSSEQVLKIYELLLKNKIKVNEIVFSKNNEIAVKYKEMDYSLFRVNCLENEIVELKDFFNIRLNETSIDWGIIWSNKIDYFMYQVNQRGLGKENILNSFSYYVGLAENAIQYYNFINKNDIIVGIQHKRIYADNYEINFYNPLNMVVDYNIRDISEYIKFAFFNNKLNVDVVINYINKLNLNNTMMNLLFARLLFPTYYFDYYEKLVNDEIDEKEVISIIKKSIEYETFLNDFYNYYKSTYALIKVEWLIKK